MKSKVSLKVKSIDETIEGGIYKELSICLGAKKIGFIELYSFFSPYGKDWGISYGYVKSIEIIPDYRRQGIGTAILMQLAEENRKIYLYADNSEAERLYQRIGEVVEGSQIPSELDGEDYDTMYMIY